MPVEFDRGLDSYEKSSDKLFRVILRRYDSSFEGLNRRRLHEPKNHREIIKQRYEIRHVQNTIVHGDEGSCDLR